jgi:hypothetical protein
MIRASPPVHTFDRHAQRVHTLRELIYVQRVLDLIELGERRPNQFIAGATQLFHLTTAPLEWLRRSWHIRLDIRTLEQRRGTWPS